MASKTRIVRDDGGRAQRFDAGRARVFARRAFALLLIGAAVAGCATVPQNRRALLADPMMGLTDEPMDAYRRQKLYDSREGAAGGDGAAAGGGCGCQ
jgi:hypothetical protein